MDEVQQSVTAKKKPLAKIILWIILVIIGIVAAVQYINAARYEMLVQVIEENKIGVNPTGERLDFGDLPRDRDAVRMVTLKSEGDTPTYVVVWKRGEVSDFVKVGKNFFTLPPRSEDKLEFSIHIPDSAEYRYYHGKVVIFQIPKIW